MRQRRAWARRKTRLCPPYACRREIFDAPPRVLYPQGNEHRIRCMKDELTTILEAMRAAHAELADYLVSGDRNAELPIAKLVGILERREVVRAMRSLRALERPGAPQLALAEAS